MFSSRLSRRFRWPGMVVAAAACGAALLVPMSGVAEAQTGPTVTDQGATTVYYNGAQISGTLASPDVVIVSVNYGPVGGTQTSPEFGVQAGPGTNAPVAVTVSQLSPGTTYQYQWTIYDEVTGSFTEGPSGTFTTGALPTGAATPIVPPANPPGNGIYDDCGADAECLADINGVRAAQENLQPITLPTNWTSLTGAEQIFVFTNLERVSRGENPIPNLVNTYDDLIQTAIADDADPAIPPGITGGAIWSGFGSPLGAMLGWEYYDGPGGANLDCTTPTSPGCWGHRDNILNPDWNEMDAGAGTDSSGNPGQAALLYINPGTPPAANVVLTWASELPFLT